MDMGLKGKRALVFASSKGLGKAIAQMFVNEGAIVAVCSRRQEAINATAQDIGAIPFVADLTEPGSAHKIVHEVIDQLGGVDILVLNNGGPPHVNFEEADDQKWRDAYESLFMTGVEAIRAALPGMLDRKWGRVIALTSVGAKEPLPKLILSNSIRAGVLGLINSLSKEYAASGVTFNSVLPGMTLTDRIQETARQMHLSLEELAERFVPMKRLADPKELAALFTFLASEHAGFITGQAIACDGAAMRSI